MFMLWSVVAQVFWLMFDVLGVVLDCLYIRSDLRGNSGTAVNKRRHQQWDSSCWIKHLTLRLQGEISSLFRK